MTCTRTCTRVTKARNVENLALAARSVHLSRMRMGNEDRRTVVSEDACVVCGISDTRLLSYTRLEDGQCITVCGSHKVAHRRSERLARTVEELQSLVGERRKVG